MHFFLKDSKHLFFLFHKLLIGNQDRHSIALRSFTPRIEARYVRVNPQYWKNWICMRVELYGCSANEGMKIISVCNKKRVVFSFSHFLCHLERKP